MINYPCRQAIYALLVNNIVKVACGVGEELELLHV